MNFKKKLISEKQIKYLVIITLLLTFSFLFVQTSLASTFDQVIKGFAETGKNAGYKLTGYKPTKEFVPAFSIFINSALTLMGALFMVLVIYGGYLWMTARGREEQVEKAKNLIIQASIGLGIVIAARLIVELVITFLGTTILPTSTP